MSKTYKLYNNIPESRYEFIIDGETPLLQYIKHGNVLYLIHTEVPADLGGHGIGTQLVEESLEDIKKNNEKIVPLCPFVADYIEKHPEWRSIVLGYPEAESHHQSKSN